MVLPDLIDLVTADYRLNGGIRAPAQEGGLGVAVVLLGLLGCHTDYIVYYGGRVK
jgi:hypothetical protein